MSNADLNHDIMHRSYQGLELLYKDSCDRKDAELMLTRAELKQARTELDLLRRVC